MAENPSLTAGWKVVFDARGHLIEPHTRFSIALGTLEVESYLRSLDDPRWLEPAASMPDIETSGPSGRYGALLFREKEGFNELFDEVQLGERYDIAIMSTKGVSVTAARRLVDEICARYQIPLFVLHDFDKSGFTILRTLQCDTRRYTFANKINVIDLGLRLADVEKHGLESESVQYRESARSIRLGLAESGATEAEIAFLLHDRVELNAFTSDELVEWIERKLKEHGVRKVIPDQRELTEAYRRQRRSAYLKKHFGELLERSRQHIADLDIPVDLQEHVARLLQQQPELSWDDAIAEIVADAA
jgi:Topoisomerase 6 subunit A/Spo11, Toprim domain